MLTSLLPPILPPASFDRRARSLRSRSRASLILLCAGLLAGPSLAAQQGAPPRDSQPRGTRTLEAVRVGVARDIERSVLELPFAITRLSPDSLRPQLRRVSVGDLLFAIPGVQVQTRNNPTQDARIAVRGFGARSAFGVRGVKVLRDGIPLTLPDGQTPMDWLDVESVGSVEAIRGTAAALYGNAAGGVLDFRTLASSAAPASVRARAWDGGGARRVSVLGSGTFGAPDATDPAATPSASTWLGSLTQTRTDGPRVYAEQQTTSAFLRLEGTLGNTRLRFIANGFDMPTALNPGALTAEELARDVRLADSVSIVRGARKTVKHGQIGVVAEQGTASRNLAAAAWVGARELDNPLSFAVITVDRRNMGMWMRGSAAHGAGAFTGRLSVGLDVQSVRDDRTNLDNCVGRAVSANCPVAGADRGALRLDQREEVQSTGGFARYELALPHGVDASAALRVDQLQFRLSDRFVTDADRDDSGTQTQSAVNPMLGLTWRVRPTVSLYATLSTAFETPSVTELTTQADGSAGLNADLSPQRTRTVETGVRGLLDAQTWVDLAVFDARSTDELIPFDIPDAPGRRAYRNAGRTARRGVEASVRRLIGSGEVGVSYTGSRFRFDDYEVDATRYDGNPIPGIPAHQTQAWATVRRGAWFATADVALSSSVSVNDANTERSAGWAAVGVRVGGEQGLRAGRLSVAPVVGIENLFDRRYAAAVLVNASRGRFYEPAAPRTVFAGLRIEFP